MATLSLKISVVGSSVVKTMQFDPATIVFDACRILRDKIPEANEGNGKIVHCFFKPSLFSFPPARRTPWSPILVADFVSVHALCGREKGTWVWSEQQETRTKKVSKCMRNPTER